MTDIFNIEIENGGEEIGQDSNNNKCQQNYCAQSLSHLETLLEKLLANEISKSEIVSSFVLQNLEYKYFDKIENLKKSRTGKLWIQYSDMILILRKFITAERLGDWNLRLKTLTEMLPYLAGHNLYTKSLVVYLDSMKRLQDTHPNVYQHFIKGKHVIRRSDREWAGLSPDLVIEQELMRSLKTSGGLTRGSGMSEFQ